MLTRYEAKYQDIAMELGRAIHAESRFGAYEYSDRKTLALLANPSVFCMLYLVEGKGAGFFLGIVQQMWFSEKKFGFDLALYIKPEHRGGSAAVRMVREFEKFCRASGCSEVNLSSSAEISTELAHRLYLGLGYQDCGFIVRKQI